MKRMVSLLAFAAIALTLSACNQPPDTHDADVLALKANEAQWNQDYVSKDINKIMAHFSDDAVMMVSASPAVSGKEAIRSTMPDFLSDPALSLKFQASKVEVSKSGDLAYTQGSYTLTVTDPQTHQPVNDHGSYVTTYRKQPDGSWKAVADIATSEVPQVASVLPNPQQRPKK
jgi:uncharacterized protein (TIGR02246 family)